MSPGNIIELLIIVLIAIGIGAAVWRGGARNPVGTGGLDKKIVALGNELKTQNAAISSEIAGVKATVGTLQNRVEEIEREKASVSDIKRIEKAIDRVAKAQAEIEGRQRALSDKQGEHAATSAATSATVQQIAKQVDLIMSAVVPKGMEK